MQVYTLNRKQTANFIDKVRKVKEFTIDFSGRVQQREGWQERLNSYMAEANEFMRKKIAAEYGLEEKTIAKKGRFFLPLTSEISVEEFPLINFDYSSKSGLEIVNSNFEFGEIREITLEKENPSSRPLNPRLMILRNLQDYFEIYPSQKISHNQKECYDRLIDLMSRTTD